MSTESLADIIERARNAGANVGTKNACACGVEIPWPSSICEPCAAKRAYRRRVDAVMRSVPQAFQWCRFGEPDLAKRVANGTAIRQARALRDAHRVVFVGAAGTGKTCLAVAMMRDRAETSRDTSCTFVGSWQLGTARARAEDSEPHMVNKALRTDLLLLDDLGSERNIPSNPIPDVLFERHAQDKATWITTWMQPEDVRQRYGDGIARRVFERAAIIDCAGVVR